MANRIEIESKFFCREKEKLYEIMKQYEMQKEEKIEEIDEYFTDMDCEYIRNRTCLRIRKTNNQQIELTFKGKSNILGNTYAKKESNIQFPISEYEDMVHLLNALGYYRYVTVNKNRTVYTKKQENCIFNVMIDEVKDIGQFIEIEILCEHEEVLIEELKEKLNQFVSIFECLNLQVATLPYRDFVAQELFSRVKHHKTISTLMLDLDGTLINSEKEFFKAFQEVMYQMFQYKITLKEYIDNELKKDSNLLQYLKSNNAIPKGIEDREIMEQVYTEYTRRFEKIIKSSETFVNIQLLQKLKNKGMVLALVTTCSKRFVKQFIETLNIETLFSCIITREDVQKLKPNNEAYELAVKRLNVDKEHTLAVEDSMRGIIAAQTSNIPVVCVDLYSLSNDTMNNVVHIESFEQLALLLLANL